MKLLLLCFLFPYVAVAYSNVHTPLLHLLSLLSLTHFHISYFTFFGRVFFIIFFSIDEYATCTSPPLTRVSIAVTIIIPLLSLPVWCCHRCLSNTENIGLKFGDMSNPRGDDY